MSIKISRTDWGSISGNNVYLFRLQNSSGAYAEVTNFGAAVTAIVVPDNKGTMENVTIGFPGVEAYADDTCYIGATVGRYANRISNAGFTLNGHTYKLDANDGANSLHGGLNGFNKKVFGFEMAEDHLVMVLHSDAGEGGFPGNLYLRISYYWSDDNELSIRYHAVSDEDTFANFTNHAYFNLSGSGADILDHQLTINADEIVASNQSYIPTGKLEPAGANAFNNHLVKEHLHTENGRLSGVNAFYILNDNKVNAAGYAALLTHQPSGRTLTVTTSYPGIFLYTGDYLTSKHLNLNNRYCQPFEGIALECQHYPDAMNRPEFPSPLLAKHHVYNQHINLKFGLI